MKGVMQPPRSRSPRSERRSRSGPEQAGGESDVDFRTDIYALGATLYHMLTGQTPFDGSSMMETLRMQMTQNLPDPRTINPEVSDMCVQLLELMLAKDRNQRYQRWRDALADIDQVLSEQHPS